MLALCARPRRGLPPNIEEHLRCALGWQTVAQPILVARPGTPKGNDCSLTVRVRGEEGQRKAQVKSMSPDCKPLMSLVSYLPYTSGNCDGAFTEETTGLGWRGQIFPGSAKTECVNGSPTRVVCITSDCAGTPTSSQVLQLGTCIPSSIGTSSIFVTSADRCTAMGTSSSEAGNHVNIVLMFMALGFFPFAFSV